MENFRILKENSEDKTKFWEIFKIDSFNLKSGSAITLTIEQIQALIDKFIYMERIPEMVLISELANYMYINIGGTSKTPVREVFAISYLMFASPNLRFKDMSKSIITGIHFATILAYLKDADLAVAKQYLIAVRYVIDSDAIYNIVLDKFPDIPVIDGMEEEEYIEWIDSVTLNTADYIKGVIATRKAFDI